MIYARPTATLSARAACELRDTGGIDSSTVARLMMDLDRGYGFVAHNVLVVDEAGMVGTRDLERLITAAGEVGAKVVLVGDDRQLPEIDAGGSVPRAGGAAGGMRADRGAPPPRRR
jgi:ATP-dependent exoDNAse (exonuclease V) alpha subunit